jgi:hypothetical protein
LFRLFAHEIQLDGQLAYLGVEAVALTLGILRDLLNGLDALERDAGFELIRRAHPFGAGCGSLSALRFWFVSSSFCFHFGGSGWGFCPLPTTTIIA